MGTFGALVITFFFLLSASFVLRQALRSVLEPQRFLVNGRGYSLRAQKIGRAYLAFVWLFLGMAAFIYGFTAFRLFLEFTDSLAFAGL